MSAQDRVFHTFELLESIYLCLSTFEIQVAAEVCTYFRTLVERSKPLKDRVDYLKLSKPDGRARIVHMPSYRLGLNNVWHFLTETTYAEPIFFLRMPTESVENIIISESGAKHLRVLSGAGKRCYGLVVDSRYGRNIELYDNNRKWICDTAAISGLSYGTRNLTDYLAEFYPRCRRKYIIVMGTKVDHKGDRGWIWVVRSICLLIAIRVLMPYLF